MGTEKLVLLSSEGKKKRAVRADKRRQQKIGHSAPYICNLSPSEICESKHSAFPPLCSGVASSVLVQVHFPCALRNRLKAEKMLVMPAPEMWKIAWLLVFWWYAGCPGGLLILNKNGQGGQEGCTKTSGKNRTDFRFGALKMLSGVQEGLRAFEPRSKVFLLEGARALSPCFLPISLRCVGRWTA